MAYLFRFILVISLCLIGFLPARGDDDATLRRVIDGYRRLYGGTETGDEALSSIIIRGVQTQGDKTLDFLLRKKAPHSIRFRLGDERSNVICGYDGRKGWMRVQNGNDVEIKDLQASEIEALARESDFQGVLFRFIENIRAKFRLGDSVLVEGLPAYEIYVDEFGRDPVRFYLGINTNHLLKRDLLDAKGAVVMETIYRDFQMVEDFPFAFEIEDRVNGETVSLTKIKTIELNRGLLSFYFKKPTY